MLEKKRAADTLAIDLGADAHDDLAIDLSAKAIEIRADAQRTRAN